MCVAHEEHVEALVTAGIGYSITRSERVQKAGIRQEFAVLLIDPRADAGDERTLPE
jgi:hypothetical protein